MGALGQVLISGVSTRLGEHEVRSEGCGWQSTVVVNDSWGMELSVAKHLLEACSWMGKRTSACHIGRRMVVAASASPVAAGY